jgi:hypothetical protein
MRTKRLPARMLVVAAAAMAVTAVASTPLAAAETAQETINRLQSEGYTVTIDRIGTAPISRCAVTSIRNPQTNTQLVPFVGPGTIRGGTRGSVLLPQVTSQTVSVSLDCSGGGTAH